MDMKEIWIFSNGWPTAHRKNTPNIHSCIQTSSNISWNLTISTLLQGLVAAPGDLQGRPGHGTGAFPSLGIFEGDHPRAQGTFPGEGGSGSPWVGYTNDRTRSPWSRNGDPHIPKCHLPSTEWKFEWEQSNVRQKVANCPILHSQRLPCLQFDKISDQDFDAQ